MIIFLFFLSVIIDKKVRYIYNLLLHAQPCCVAVKRKSAIKYIRLSQKEPEVTATGIGSRRICFSGLYQITTYMLQRSVSDQNAVTEVVSKYQSTTVMLARSVSNHNAVIEDVSKSTEQNSMV